MSDHARILASLPPVDLSRVERLQDWEAWTEFQRESRIVRHAETVRAGEPCVTRNNALPRRSAA